MTDFVYDSFDLLHLQQDAELISKQFDRNIQRLKDIFSGNLNAIFLSVIDIEDYETIVSKTNDNLRGTTYTLPNVSVKEMEKIVTMYRNGICN